MKLLKISIMFCLLSTLAYGQNDVQFTHFMFNKMGYNPAFAGSNDALTVGAIYREQWVNIDGAPRSINAHVHTPFANNRNGIGLSLTSDEIGLFKTNTVELSYSYAIPFGKNKLSIGINGRLEQAGADWTKAKGIDAIDKTLPAGGQKAYNPNFGFGVNYNAEHFYVGASVLQLMNNSYYNYNNEESKINMHTLYLMGGTEMPLGSKVKFVPTVLATFNPNAPFDLDVNAGFLFVERFYAALNYRLSDSFDFMLMYQLSPQLRLGAAYDFTMSELSDKTPGSFEFLGSYIFNYDDKKIKNIRFF